MSNGFSKMNTFLTPEYSAWMSNKIKYSNNESSRTRPKHVIGKKFHSEWKNSFQTFLNDVGHRPSSEHMLLVRDSNVDFIPGNVFWCHIDDVTTKTNLTNVRTRKIDREAIRCDWEAMCLVMEPRNPTKPHVGEDWYNSFDAFARDISSKPYGNYKLVRRDPLSAYQKGNCYWKKQDSVDAENHSPEYTAWEAMRKRCIDESGSNYRNYGSRGISVCDRWNHSYRKFLEDMGRRPTDKHSIDRIDNDKGYSPDNCRWATVDEQLANRRNTRWITEADGTKISFNDYSIKYGISRETLDARHDRNTPYDKPVMKMNEKYAYRGKECITSELSKYSKHSPAFIQDRLAREYSPEEAVESPKCEFKKFYYYGELVEFHEIVKRFSICETRLNKLLAIGEEPEDAVACCRYARDFKDDVGRQSWLQYFSKEKGLPACVIYDLLKKGLTVDEALAKIYREGTTGAPYTREKILENAAMYSYNGKMLTSKEIGLLAKCSVFWLRAWLNKGYNASDAVALTKWGSLNRIRFGKYKWTLEFLCNEQKISPAALVAKIDTGMSADEAIPVLVKESTA